MLAAGKDGGNVNPDAPENVWMPDAKLRQAVRDRLGIKDDETLSKTQMTQLTELRVHDQGEKRMSRRTAHDVLKKAFVSAGLNGHLATHFLRKSFAQRLYDRSR